MSHQRLTDSERLAFQNLFPHEKKWVDFLPVEYNCNHDNKEHVSDIHRAKKRLVGELRALNEVAESEKRELTATEMRGFEAASKIIENLNYSISVDEFTKNPEYRNGPQGIQGIPGSYPNQQKIVFSHNEKISDFRQPSGELRGLSLGRMMNIMANGAAKAQANEKEIRTMNEGTGSAAENLGNVA